MTNPAMRVLLIEDDPGMARLMQYFLKPYSSVVTWCRTLRNALSVSDSSKFDVILLDLRLPDSHERDDTLTKIPDLKQHQPSAAMIVISGADNVDEMRAKSLDYGADLYLDKMSMGETAGKALYGAIASAIVGHPSDDRSPTFEQHVAMLQQLATA